MEQEFKSFLQKIVHFHKALSVLGWDLRTGLPKKGVAERAKLIGTLSSEVFSLTTSPEMERFLNYYEEPEHYDKLDAVMKAAIRECKKDFKRFRKIPPEKHREYVMLTKKSESVWVEAKQNNDFKLFAPYLEKIVAYQREFEELWGYEENRYDPLLQNYEPEITVKQLDKLFGDLKSEMVPFLNRVMDSHFQPETAFLYGSFNVDGQALLSKHILTDIGYDFEAGRLDVSEHPFTVGFNPGDVRITTHYKKNNLTSALFASIHEAGHAIYDQNIDMSLVDTNLCMGSSFGIHESQSRFWENIVGRSLAFWKRYIPALQEYFSEAFNGLTAESFYYAVNNVRPSLIRIHADELTYDLHIMVRYEIEKGLMNDSFKVSELPEVWNQKYKDYLDITPNSDETGVLQDIHWSSGYFGYFPSYTLGNVYAAQILNAMKKDLGDIHKLVEDGEFQKIRKWLTDKIHKHGKMLSPAELIKSATGEPLTTSYYIDYLKSKYSGIYRL